MATVDSFILKIGIQGEGEVKAATRAMQALEERTNAEKQALAGLGGSLDAAKAKLAQMQAAASLGGGKSVNIAGMLAQREKIAAIEAKQAAGGENVAKLQGAMPDAQNKIVAAEARAAAAAKQKLAEADLASKAAAEKAAAATAAQASKIKEVVPATKAVAETAKTTSISFRQLGAAAGETDGPLGNMVRAIGKFKAAGPAGAVLALVGVLILLATTAVVAAVALTRFALASADASRSARLMADAASGVEKGGEGLTSVIDDVALKSPLAREKIAAMAQAMEIARLRGRDMQNALEATATATSAVGESAGQAFKSIAEKSQFAKRFLLSRADLEGTGVAFAEVAASLAQAMGISVQAATTLIQNGGVSVAKGLEAMNAAVQAKFGKTVAAQMLAVGTQFQKMHEAFAKLFDGVDLEPFLKGLSAITGMFGQNTVTGVALKALFQSIFNPLAEGAGRVFPIVEAFIQGAVIATLMMYLGFLKVKAALSDAFGGDSASKIDWIKTAMWAGGIAVVALVGGVAGLTLAIVVLAAVMLPLAVVLALPFIIAIASIVALVYAMNWVATTLNDAIIGGFQSAVAWMKGLDFGAIASDLIAGLVNGFKTGGALVVAAVKSLGTGAMTALKGILGIHSPSTVFHAYGMYTAEGFSDGVEAGAPAANSSVKALGGGKPDGNSTTVNRNSRGGHVFNFHGTREDYPSFRKMLRDVLGQDADRSPEPA